MKRLASRRTLGLAILGAFALTGAVLLAALGGTSQSESAFDSARFESPTPRGGGEELGYEAPHELPEGCVRDAVGEPFAYSHRLGRTLRYAFHHRQVVRFEPNEAFLETISGSGDAGVLERPRGMDVEISGKFVQVVSSADEEEALVSYRFEDVRLRSFEDGAVREGESDSLCRLEREFLVRTNPRGEILELRFPVALGPEETDLLLGLVAVYRVVVPGTDRSSWETREEDPLGEFDARYEADSTRTDPVGIGKTVKRYRSFHARAAAGEGALEAVVGGGTRARFSREAGLLIEVSAVQSISLEVARQPYRILSTCRSTLELLEVGEGSPPPLASLSASRTRSIRGFVREGDEAGHRELDRLRERAAGRTMDEVLLELEEVAACGSWHEESGPWLESLSAIFATDSSAVARSLDLVGEARGASREVLHGIVMSLGEAGTPEAQAALLGIVGEGALPAELRQAAVLSLVLVERPEESILGRCLASATRDEDSISLGLLEGLGISAAKSRGPMKERILETLEEVARHAKEPSRLRAALLGLGNAGLDRSFSVLASQATHADAVIRQAAVRSLRKLSRTRTLPVLAGALLRDASEDVRAAGVQALGVLPDRDSDGLAARVLRQDGSERVRLEAVAYLEARLAASEDSREALERAAREDDSDEVRRAAERALGGGAY